MQFDTLHHQCLVDEMLQIRVLELRAGERLKLKLWSCSSDVVWRRRSEPLRTVWLSAPAVTTPCWWLH